MQTICRNNFREVCCEEEQPDWTGIGRNGRHGNFGLKDSVEVKAR